MPHCGPPINLSPLNKTRSAPARILSPTTGSSRDPEAAEIDQRTGPNVVNDGQLMFAAQAHQLIERGLFGEADNPEVAGVNAQQRGGIVRDRRLVVANPGLVGRADLSEARPRSPT